jgi:hypothetical protein
MREGSEMGHLDEDLVVGRMLVVESALTADLLVATPAGGASSGVLLVAARESRTDGTRPARLVRVLVGLKPEEELPAIHEGAQGEADVFAVVDWESMSCSDNERIYLVSRANLEDKSGWRQACWQASPQRWSSLLQVRT